MYQVLVVDDEPKVRWRVQHMVGGFDVGWTSIAASDGAQALELLEALAVDLVLTDIRMPTMDGLTLLEEMRGRGSGALVAMLSAHADFAYAQQALRLGALDYLVKPLDPASLRALLVRAGQILALEGGGKHTESLPATNREVLRTRLVTDLLDGRLPAADWASRARPLGLTALYAQVITLSHQPADQESVMRWLQDTQRLLPWNRSPVLIPWDRTHLSIVAFMSPDPRPTSGLGASADQPSIIHALQQCPVPGTRHGIGEPRPIAEARTSYLDSLRLLHEREVQTMVSTAAYGSGTVSASAQQAVQRARSWIAAHYDQPVSLSDVARDVHFHPKYLCAVFPFVAGCSFSEYLTATRVEAAKALLTTTRTPCHLIAEQVGYQNERCFAQAFRRRVGLTPSDYRHAHS